MILIKFYALSGYFSLKDNIHHLPSLLSPFIGGNCVFELNLCV
jgi:hypothetical protein